MTGGGAPAARFAPDRATYIQSHVTLAVLAMPAAMILLWLTGTPHVWTGAVGALAAVAARGWYLMSEELGHVWEMTGDALHGPAQRHVALADLSKVRRIGSAVQLITRTGDKHLIKFQPEPAAVVARIEAARPRAETV